MKGGFLAILLGLALVSCSRDGNDAPRGPAGASENSTTYVVRGEVAAPGEWPWVRGVTISAAIENAGGLTPSAAGEYVNLVRLKQVTLHDLGRIRAGQATDTPLMAGDVVSVPRRFEK